MSYPDFIANKMGLVPKDVGKFTKKHQPFNGKFRIQLMEVLYRMGPPVDSVQLVYKWLNSMVYGRYNELVNGDYNGL